MKADSLYDKPVVVNVEQDEGSVEGYVVNSVAEQIVNWLAKHGIYDEAKVAYIRATYPRIAMLDNINVEEDYRGKGVGNQLLESFISNVEIEEANAILLVADTAETQQEGFDLVRWYKHNGFDELMHTGAGPLMLKEL